MKNIVIYGNCHTFIIIKCLQYSETIKNLYNINKIYIVDFLDHNELDEKSIELIKNADLFICQYIEKDRGLLNHTYLKKFIKDTCDVFFFPHFRFDCYLLNNHVFDSVSVELGYVPFIPIELFKLFNSCATYNDFNANFDNVYNNVKILQHTEIDKLLNIEKNKFVEINKYSSIDMQDYVLNNYITERLFGCYSYPTEKFFYEFVKKILEKIEIYDIKSYEEKNDCIYNIWNNTLFPIIPSVYNYLKLDHRTNYNSLTIKNYYTNIPNLRSKKLL